VAAAGVNVAALVARAVGLGTGVLVAAGVAVGASVVGVGKAAGLETAPGVSVAVRVAVAGAVLGTGVGVSFPQAASTRASSKNRPDIRPARLKYCPLLSKTRLYIKAFLIATSSTIPLTLIIPAINANETALDRKPDKKKLKILVLAL
jgi:hypothetical protein